MKKTLLTALILLGLVFVLSAQTKHAVGDKCCGGIVFKVESGGQHGLVAAERDLSGKYNWDDAKNACNGLSLNGFSNWRLPNKEELNMMYQNKNLIGDFASVSYWSSSESANANAWLQNFVNGAQSVRACNEPFPVRAVRVF